MSPVFNILASLGVGIGLALCPCCGTNGRAQAAPAETSPAVSTVTLTVEGMTCASCSVAGRTALKRLDGVRDARVSVEEKRAVVDYEPAKVTPQKMIDAVNALGYRASLAPKGS
jgi:copper chaperone CopZ